MLIPCPRCQCLGIGHSPINQSEHRHSVQGGIAVTSEWKGSYRPPDYGNGETEDSQPAELISFKPLLIGFGVYIRFLALIMIYAKADRTL